MTHSTPSLPKTKIESRLREDMSRQIDAWIATQPEPRPTRSEAIRRLLGEALAREAAVKSPPPSASLPPPSSPAFQPALKTSASAKALAKARKSRGHR